MRRASTLRIIVSLFIWHLIRSINRGTYAAVAVLATAHTQIFKKQRISLSFSEPLHFHIVVSAKPNRRHCRCLRHTHKGHTRTYDTSTHISFEHLHVDTLKECTKACACMLTLLRVYTNTYVKVSNVLCMGAFRVKSFHAKQAKVSALGMLIRPKLQMVFCCCDNEHRNIVQTRKTSPHHIRKAFAHLCLRHCHRPNFGKLARHESQTGSRVDGTTQHTQHLWQNDALSFIWYRIYTHAEQTANMRMWMCICEQVARVWPTVYLLVSH